MFSNGNEAKGLITITEWFLTRLFVELSTEVTLTKRFATTVFSPTQRCNIVATLFRMVTTFFQHWKAVEKKVLMIYEINHIWTAEMKWKWRNDRRSERNLCNCVKKPEKNSGLQRGLNPWPTSRFYRCDALATELWSHWRLEQVSCGFICSRERNEC